AGKRGTCGSARATASAASSTVPRGCRADPTGARALRSCTDRAVLLPESVEMKQRRVPARQGIRRRLQIRIADRHLDKEARVKERLDDRPCHAHPFRVVFRLET